jgi:hypothetical protein
MNQKSKQRPFFIRVFIRVWVYAFLKITHTHTHTFLLPIRNAKTQHLLLMKKDARPSKYAVAKAQIMQS